MIFISFNDSTTRVLYENVFIKIAIYIKLVGHAPASTTRAVSNVHVTFPNARIGQIKVWGLVELKKSSRFLYWKKIGVLVTLLIRTALPVFSLHSHPLTKNTPLIPIKRWLSPPPCHNWSAHGNVYKYGVLRVRNNTIVARNRKYFVCDPYCFFSLLNFKSSRQINCLGRVSKNILKKILNFEFLHINVWLFKTANNKL